MHTAVRVPFQPIFVNLHNSRPGPLAINDKNNN